MTDMLPPNSTALERALAASSGVELLPVELDKLWSANDCPAPFLPYLAWALAVDFWDMATTEAQQRALIAGAIAWHQKRGTPWAIRQALAAIGYPVLDLVEQADYQREWLAAGGLTLDGTWSLDGNSSLTPPESSGATVRRTALNHWAEYAIRLNAVDGAWSRSQQERIRKVAEAYAPARSRLVAIISSLAARAGRPVRVIALRQRVRVNLNHCTRVQPLQRRTLDGCWSLGGERAPQLLDGVKKLAGTFRLDGHRLIGAWEWAAGHARITQRLSLRFRAALGTGAKEALPTLSAPQWLLDGKQWLGELTLQGWPLDEGIALGDARLDRVSLRKLDGNWQLGPRATATSVRAKFSARIREHGITQQVAL